MNKIIHDKIMQEIQPALNKISGEYPNHIITADVIIKYEKPKHLN